MRQGRNIGMPERGDTVSHGRRRLMIVRSVVLRCLPRRLVSGQMLLLALLLGHAMRMRGAVVQFGRLWVVLVMRAVIITSGHMSWTPQLRISDT